MEIVLACLADSNLQQQVTTAKVMVALPKK